MQSLNVFVIGEGKICSKLTESKLLNKLYTTGTDIKNAIPVEFESVESLVKKCKGLQVDMVIIEDSDLMSIGLTDMLRQNHINCFGANKIWAELLQDDSCSRKLANRYQIQKPKILNYPKEFPLMVKADGFTKIANSMSELLEIKESLPISSKNIYLEEYIEGDKIILTSLFDGKNLLNFPLENLNEKQDKKLKEYSKKLRALLQEEKAEFLGFINSEFIRHDNNWYHLGFDLNYNPQNTPKEDMMFILNAAIYQKLDEISLSL